MSEDQIRAEMMKHSWLGEYGSDDITVDDAVEVAMMLMNQQTRTEFTNDPD